jgi:protein-disulfide isomerase
MTMRFRIALAGVLALIASAQQPARLKPSAARPAAAGRSALDKATLESYLRNLELWPSQIQVKIDEPKAFIRDLYQVDVHLSAGPATKDLTYYVSADGKTVIRGSAHNIDRSPFYLDLEHLKLEHQPSFGPANAPLTLAVLSDFECPVCREEAKELREKAAAEFPKELRVVFADFPLESIHPWAKPAAIAGRCVYRLNPAAFWDYHDWMFEHQQEIKIDNLRSKITDWAKSKSLDATQLGQCVDTRATEAEVNTEIAMGKQLQVDSTPTLFLNGRRLAGHIPWQNLSQIIKLELEFQKHPIK